MNSHAETILTTPRLKLRPWRESDLAPFAAMNADPRVMRHFPKPLTREESDAVAQRIANHFTQHGFGNFAVEESASGSFIGFVGFNLPTFHAHFTPCVEIGWRIHHDFQRQGYATEAARAALQFGFEILKLDELVAFTVPANQSSWALMERLGMTHSSADDFDHPRLPKDHPICRHILYRLTLAQWKDHEARIFQSTPQPQYGRRIDGRTYIVRPGSYAVIENENGQVAIAQTAGGIGLPGGGADPNESPEQTLDRELREETGRRILTHRNLGRALEFVHSTTEGNFEKQCSFFHCSFDPHAPASPPEPGTHILWLTPHDAIAVLTHQSHRWAVAQTLAHDQRPTKR